MTIGPMPRRHGPLPFWLPRDGAITEAGREEPDAITETHRRALDVGLSHAAV